MAAYVERLGQARAPQTVKQHLAAIRSLFDFLVTGGVIRLNPAAAVRGPKHSTQKGKTPILFADEARALINSIPVDTLVGLRDRALIGVMTYGFARVSAALAMAVKDVFPIDCTCACSRKAVNTTKYRATISSRNICANILMQPTLIADRCSARFAVKPSRGKGAGIS